MSKLDIIKTAKKSKSQAETAAAIRKAYETFAGLTDEATCLAFGSNMLDKDTRKTFYKALGL